jgi:HK97 family phage portal protein
MSGLVRSLLTGSIRAEDKGTWQPQTIQDLDRQIALGGAMPTYTGVNISENLAMNLPPVFACVRVRAETMGQLSLHLYQRKDKGAEKATWHPTYHLIHDEPNEEMTSISWRMAQQAHVDTWGNAYCWIDVARVGRNAGSIRQLYPLKPDRVTPRRENGRIKYDYKKRRDDGSTETVTYDMSQILHISGMGYDGIMGYSPVQYNRQALGIGFALEQYLGRTFGNGVNIRGVFTGGQAFANQEQLDTFRKGFLEQYASLDKAGGLMFLFGADKFDATVLPLEDAEFLAERKYTREEIAGIWRVPAHMIGDLSRSTNNNIEHQGLEFAMYTMMPPCRSWEQAMNKRLLTPADKAAGYYSEYDLKSLMRGDMKARGEWYKTMKQVGAYNANRILEAEGENLRQDSGGENYWDEGPQGQGVGGQQQNQASAKALRPVFVDAAARIMKREAQDIIAQAEKWTKRDDMDGFSGWLGEFWGRHEQACVEILRPGYAAMGCPERAEVAAKDHITVLKGAIKAAQTDGIDAVKQCVMGRNPEDMPLFGEFEDEIDEAGWEVSR